MSEGNRPWGGESQGEHPTEQFWHGVPPAAGPGGSPPPGGPADSGQTYRAWQQATGLGEHLRGDRRRASRWTLGIVAASVLAVGGVAAGLAMTSHAVPAAATSPATGATSSGTTGSGTTGSGAPGAGAAGSGGGTGGQAGQALSGQAAMLNATLSSANSPGPLTVATSSAAAAGPGSSTAAAHKAAAVCAKARSFAKQARQAGFHRLARLNHRAARRCRLARHHLLGHHRMFRFFLLHGLDGQYTFQTKHGTKTQAYQRGVVQSVSAGHSIVVKASNGDVWTWDLTSSTVVRDRSGKVAASSLADGQTVWAGGPVVSGARDAALIVINPPAPPAAH